MDLRGFVAICIVLPRNWRRQPKFHDHRYAGMALQAQGARPITETPMGRPREKPCSLAFQPLSTMPTIPQPLKTLLYGESIFNIFTFCSSYIFHLRSVNECFEKENNPFPFHRLSCIPISPRPSAFTTPIFWSCHPKDLYIYKANFS